MADTPLQSARRRTTSLIAERKDNGWDAHYRELAEHINPWKSRFMASDRNKGQKRNTKILAGAARKANRILSSGMMSGLTNPSRPWFSLETFDPDLLEYAPVKAWLERVEYVMNTIFQRSNLYQTLPNVYTELGAFGTGCFSIMEDFEDIIITRPYTVGEYAISQDHRGRCNAFTREYEDTVENVVGLFGLGNVCSTTKRAYEKGNYDNPVQCFHLIEANHDEKIWLGMGQNRPFRNLYWEQGALDGKEGKESFLEARGMFEFPVFAPRWDTNSGDIYGNGPGQDALADIKQMQVMEKRKLNKLEKHNNPPMKGPATLKNERSSSLPGDMTYVPDNANAKYEPAYQIDGNINDLREEIATKKQEIMEYFYADVFQKLLYDNRNQRATAREIAEIHEEKLLQLGPVLNKLDYEGFDPAITRTFKIAERAARGNGMIPPAPDEMKGHPITVKYTSILAQAQRLVDSASIERMATFTTTLGAAFPNALDRFDEDVAIDKYQEIVGAPVGVIRPLAQAEERRKARAAAEQQSMQIAQGAQAVETAKQLSETNTSGGNALADILGL